MNIFKKMKLNGVIPKLNLLLVLILVIALTYPLYAPIVPAVYDKPVIQDTLNIRAGHELTYKIHACRNVGDGVITNITRKLVSTTNKELTPITLSTDTLTNKARCADTKKTIIVPYDVPTGTYQLVVQGIYAVIPLRQPITVTATSDSFVVQGATPSEDIQALIEANDKLRGQIEAQIEANSDRPIKGTSSTQSNVKQPSPTTETGAPSTPGSASPSTQNGLLPNILNVLSGGVDLPL